MSATETTTAAEGGVGVPWRSPTLVAILAATLMTPMDVPMVSPALTEVRAAFGVSQSRAGLFVTLYALPGIAMAPIVGALADRVGRRYVLSGCLAVFGVAGTAIGFTGDFTMALGLRIVQGFAAGSILSALAMTVVGDRYDGPRHDAVMGVTSATLALGTAAYPVVGGYLAGHAWNAPFLLYALTLPVAAFVLFGMDDRGPSLAPTEGGYLREAVRAVPTRRALGLYGVMFASFALLFGGIYTALPFYLGGTFGFGAATVGLLTSATLLVTAAVSTANGRLAARASRTTLLATGFALYAVGLAGIALAGEVPALVGALLVFGAGNGLVTPTLFGALSALAPDHVRAGVMSLQTTTIGTSQTLGPAAFTLLGGAVGFRATILGAGGAAAVLAAALGAVALDG